MDYQIQIIEKTTNPLLVVVGSCTKYNEFQNSEHKIRREINGQARCNPEEVNVEIKNGVCMDFDCPFRRRFV